MTKWNKFMGSICLVTLMSQIQNIFITFLIVKHKVIWSKFKMLKSYSKLFQIKLSLVMLKTKTQILQI